MIKQLKNCSISNISKKVMQLVFLLPFTAILAYAIIGSSNYFFLIIVALLIFFTVLTRFTIALIMIGLASYFLTYTIWYFNLPKPLTNLGYVLIVMVLIREYFFTANMLPVRIPINRILFFILALGFLSIAGGEATAYASFKGMLKHIGFPLLFILILMAEPDEKLMRQLVIAIIVVAFIQVAASIWQFTWYSTISPKPGGMRADRSGGLLGFSCGGYTAVFMSFTYCLIMGFIIAKGFRWYLGIGAILLLVPIYLASARAGVYFFGAASLFMLLIAPLKKHGSFFKRLLAGVALFTAIVLAAVAGLGGSAFQSIFNTSYAYKYSIKKADAGMGRLQAFEIVKTHLRTPVEMLIGRGPGTITPVSLTDNPNSLLVENPSLFKNVTGYAYTTLELGFVGLALFLLLYIQVYRFVRRFLKAIDDKFWESVALGFCGIVFVYVISTVYIDSWTYYPLPFTFWALAAAIYRVGVIRGILTV